jgi:hypothetical protein
VSRLRCLRVAYRTRVVGRIDNFDSLQQPGERWETPAGDSGQERRSAHLNAGDRDVLRRRQRHLVAGSGASSLQQRGASTMSHWHVNGGWFFDRLMRIGVMGIATATAYRYGLETYQ